MNKTIKLLMISDIFLISGLGLIAPILAIYIKENLTGGTIFSAGFASTLYLVTKCIVQLPFSKYVDIHDDKVKWLMLGALITSIVPFGYIFSTNIQHIYLIEIMYGIGSGLAFPTWLGLWSVNLDKKQESYEWSLYSTLTGLGTALTAAVGAAIANYFGFKTTFLLVGIISLIGWSILFGLEVKKEKLSKIKNIHYHKQRKYTDKEP